MPGIVLAWLFGEGLIIYRSFKKDHHPPMPGQLLVTTGLFAALGLVADASPDARLLAAALAWGFDVAAFMNLAPEITGGGTTAPARKAKA
jgi:hypothetical protein